MKTVN